MDENSQKYIERHEAYIRAIDCFVNSCSAISVDELSDEEVMSFFESQQYDLASKLSYEYAIEQIDKSNLEFKKVINSMRKAMENRVSFKCYYISSESAFGPSEFKSRWETYP